MINIQEPNLYIVLEEKFKELTNLTNQLINKNILKRSLKNISNDLK